MLVRSSASLILAFLLLGHGSVAWADLTQQQCERRAQVLRRDYLFHVRVIEGPSRAEEYDRIESRRQLYRPLAESISEVWNHWLTTGLNSEDFEIFSRIGDGDVSREVVRTTLSESLRSTRERFEGLRRVALVGEDARELPLGHQLRNWPFARELGEWTGVSGPRTEEEEVLVRVRWRPQPAARSRIVSLKRVLHEARDQLSRDISDVMDRFRSRFDFRECECTYRPRGQARRTVRIDRRSLAHHLIQFDQVQNPFRLSPEGWVLRHPKVPVTAAQALPRCLYPVMVQLAQASSLFIQRGDIVAASGTFEEHQQVYREARAELNEFRRSVEARADGSVEVCSRRRSPRRLLCYSLVVRHLLPSSRVHSMQVLDRTMPQNDERFDDLEREYVFERLPAECRDRLGLERED